jgi:phenylacetic acid degradation operon negative regulatory protein
MNQPKTPVARSGSDRQSGARSLLMTTLGEFVLPHGGGVWTTTLVDALIALDVTERNARQAIARSGDQGIIRVERHGRLARWHLTEQGTTLLTTGAERIYGLGARSDSWDQRWLVIICSVPETHRAKRHQLRTRMTFEGFGFIAPGIAVSPHLDREEAANRILHALDLHSEAITFTATKGSLTLDAEVLAKAWELDTLANQYQAFIDEFQGQHPPTDMAALTTTVRMVDAWRMFPFIDPELPTQLLPEDWIGSRAQNTFNQRRSEWSAAALAWFKASESHVAAPAT